MDDDGLLAFGDFEIDTSTSDARAARIAAARVEAKQYSAKIEEDGWFNDPNQVSRMKDPTRPAMFSLHQLYFQQQYKRVINQGLPLLKAGVKDESELMDLIMRAWHKATLEVERSQTDEVVAVAKRWIEYASPFPFGSHKPNQASICHISAQVLFAASRSTDEASTSLWNDALSAALSSLRTNRTLSPFLTTLEQILAVAHSRLAALIQDRTTLAKEREEVLAQVEVLNLDPKERETLELVLGLHGEEKEIEEDAGRDVRSL
ncbi:uncharacterized protein JCM15063_004717 [Sporobolomyces koalae]|uniref:uncharacterized protein n=1 Tax=Sporobolomyces koalae TaxID=500713 RepID=UPI00317ED515